MESCGTLFNEEDGLVFSLGGFARNGVLVDFFFFRLAFLVAGLLGSTGDAERFASMFFGAGFMLLASRGKEGLSV